MLRWIGETGQIGALTNDQRFKEARSYFPTCYSNAFDQCIDKSVLGAYPNCARLLELWGTNKADPVSLKLDAEVQKMPYCQETTTTIEETTINVAPLAIAGVVGLIGGFILGRVLG